MFKWIDNHPVVCVGFVIIIIFAACWVETFG